MPFRSIPKPKLKLTRTPEEAARLFLASSTIQNTADTLEVHPGHLKRWLYEHPGHSGYKVFEIPKRTGGQRTIAAPPGALAILQRKFKTILDHVYQPKGCVFGFISGKSIVDGARRHKKRARWILNFDIQNFYPSINFGRVMGLFKALGVGPKAAAIWAHLVTLDGALPQGACTSPVLSNMIAKQLDSKMIGLARRYHLTYTRYADDLSLSTTKKSFPAEIAQVSGTGLDPDNVELQCRLLNAVQESGFAVNDKKTRLYSKAVRQEITGLTVNEFVNVRRSFIRQIRAMIYAAGKHGLEAAGTEYIQLYAPRGRISPDVLENDDFDPARYFLMVVYGKLAYVRMVRGPSDKCYVNLCLKMDSIDPNSPRQIMDIKRMYEEFQVFICHASEDKATVASPLHEALKKLGVVSFIDTEYIKWGDSFVEKINHALSRAKIVVVVLSDSSVDKYWPRKEINAALAREIEGQTKILPLMVGTGEEIQDILGKLPLLADKRYEKWTEGAPVLAKDIASLLS